MTYRIFLAMHIPDGFLTVPVAAVGWAMLIGMGGLALRQTRDTLGERQIPLMGILAAFVFSRYRLKRISYADAATADSRHR